MMITKQNLIDRIDPKRISQLTLDLVNIPSPSGKEIEVTGFLANYLQSIGLEVSLDETYPESPSIIAYVRGITTGMTLQLDGHIDTVAIEHPPAEVKNGRIYGRGAADMKGNLAAMAETARILFESELKLAGNLMLTIHGQHEDAVGDLPMHAPLLALFEKKIIGDAAIVCEGPHDGIVIAAKGLSFWEIDIRRDGDPVHEVVSGGSANPLWAAYKVLQILETQAKIWKKKADPNVGPQSFFVGQIIGGDYYNRVPNHVHLKGTRRTIPGVTYNMMRDEFKTLINKVAQEMRMKIDLKLIQSGQSYRLAPDEPIIRAVQDAYTTIFGNPLPFIGLRYTGNASQFNNIAGIPAIYFGADQKRAHATPEWIEIDRLVEAAKVYLLSTLNFLNVTNING